MSDDKIELTPDQLQLAHDLTTKTRDDVSQAVMRVIQLLDEPGLAFSIAMGGVAGAVSVAALVLTGLEPELDHDQALQIVLQCINSGVNKTDTGAQLEQKLNSMLNSNSGRVRFTSTRGLTEER